MRMHLIWSTIRRESLLDEAWVERLYRYIGGLLRERKTVLLAAGGTADHVHLYVSMPATADLAELVNAMKANSSRWVHETFPEMHNFAWQSGYGAFSVSVSADEQVRIYIANQKEHHKNRGFMEEYLEFLKRHQIECDPRYVFE
jgi:REP element-mobilizing transposase RayT